MEFLLLKDINIADSEKEVEEEIGDKEDRINEIGSLGSKILTPVYLNDAQIETHLVHLHDS